MYQPVPSITPRVTHFNLDHQFFPVPACNTGLLSDGFTFELHKVTCPACQDQYKEEA